MVTAHFGADRRSSHSAVLQMGGWDGLKRQGSQSTITFRPSAVAAEPMESPKRAEDGRSFKVPDNTPSGQDDPVVSSHLTEDANRRRKVCAD